MKLRLPAKTIPTASRDAVVAVKIQDRRRKYAERIRSADHAVDIQATKNPRRRNAALKDPEKFLRIYFRHEFRHEFDGNMREVIRIARMVLESGGRFACVLPRGAGKTTTLARLALWALLAGLRDFLVILAATDPAAPRGPPRRSPASRTVHPSRRPAPTGEELPCPCRPSGRSRPSPSWPHR